MAFPVENNNKEKESTHVMFPAEGEGDPIDECSWVLPSFLLQVRMP